MSARLLIRPTIFAATVTATAYAVAVGYDVKRNIAQFDKDNYRPNSSSISWNDFKGYVTLSSYFNRSQLVDDRFRHIQRVEQSKLPQVAKDLLCMGIERYYDAGPAQRLTYSIIAANNAVFVGWQVLPASLMFRYFIDHVGRNVVTLVGANFSHKSVVHVGFNMFALSSFIPSVYRDMSSTSELVAFYMGAAMMSSWASRVVRTIIPALSHIGSLGASGALYGILSYRALTSTERDRLQLIFLPGFSFPMFQGFQWLIGFDLVMLARTLVLRRLSGFDHAGHLGGALFGYLYLRYDRGGDFESQGGRLWSDLHRQAYKVISR